MEQVVFTPLQRKIFTEVSYDPFLSKNFYFTGGTALSVFHLHHRESEDLDFFSENKFDSFSTTPVIEKVSRGLNIPYRFTDRDVLKVYEFVKDDKLLIKVDFGYYPYKRIEKGPVFENFTIDSLRDIAANKLLTINQRTEVKDFVDLYFLLKTYTIWDLIYAVKAKFNMLIDIVLVASDFMKVEEFKFMPRMIKPLTLPTLQEFFKQKAVELAKKVVEE